MTENLPPKTSILDDLKGFLVQGNVIDLAVAVIIGASFGKIVSSLVENIVMPMVSLLIPGGQWRTAKLVLGQISKPDGSLVENALMFGQFLGAVVDFVVIGLVIFFLLRFLKSLKKPD